MVGITRSKVIFFFSFSFSSFSCSLLSSPPPSFCLVLQPASSGCSGGRLDPNSKLDAVECAWARTPNRQHRMLWSASQREGQIECQTECRNGCQKECQNVWHGRKNVKIICQIESQKECQIMSEYITYRKYVRKNAR